MASKKPLTIIIGGGPGGSSAAIYLARNIYPVLLLDAPKKVHGRTKMGTRLDNFLGHDKIVTGPEFLKKIHRQLKSLKVDYRDEMVVKVSRSPEGNFIVSTDRPGKYIGQYLIIAVGLSDNMPPIEGLDPYYDTALYHCMTCDWYDHRDKKIAIISNTDAGVKNSLKMSFYQRPPSLSIIPTISKPKYSSKLLKQAKKEGIKIYSSPIAELIGNKGKLRAIKLQNGTQVQAETIFTRLGQKRFDGFLEKGGLKPKRDADGFLKVNHRTFETSISNLFAVGPCNDMTDQVIVAGGEGALAAFEIDRRILKNAGIG